jgi:hypothetical protein
VARTSQIAGRKKDEIEVYKKRWARRRQARTKKGIEANIVTKRPWIVNFDAKEYTAVAGDAAAVGIYLALQGNYDPATLRQREPSKDKDPRRMVRTGNFVKKIQRTKVTGSNTRARCKIRGPTTGKNGAKYLEALKNEAEGGGRQNKPRPKNFYFLLDGAQETLIDKALDRWLQSAIEGKFFSISIGRRFAREIILTRAKGRRVGSVL